MIPAPDRRSGTYSVGVQVDWHSPRQQLHTIAVNLEVVWDTIHEDLPRVHPKLQEICEELPDEDT